jgi:hypothetical protein
MSRKRSRKVLYEVSKGPRKIRKFGAKLEISKRVRAFSNTVESRRVDKTRENPKKNLRPSQLKRLVFLFSTLLMKISVRKALVLLVVFAVAVIFWPFGGNSGTVEPQNGQNPDNSIVDGAGLGGSGVTGAEMSAPGRSEGTPGVSGPPKDHYIVIASHPDVDQLKALSGHFALNGIETEFKASGSRYTLITKGRYLSPGDSQSGIDQAKVKIQKVGNEYKPESNSGYLRFKFNDIYEQKVR